MITRSKRDASYEYFELPDKRKKRQKKEENVENVKVEQQFEKESNPNISISYYERPRPRPPLYEVNIDFDEAHNEWIKNKVKLKNGCYRYKKERKGNVKKVKVVREWI